MAASDIVSLDTNGDLDIALVHVDVELDVKRPEDQSYRYAGVRPLWTPLTGSSVPELHYWDGVHQVASLYPTLFSCDSDAFTCAESLICGAVGSGGQFGPVFQDLDGDLYLSAMHLRSELNAGPTPPGPMGGESPSTEGCFDTHHLGVVDDGSGWIARRVLQQSLQRNDKPAYQRSMKAARKLLESHQDEFGVADSAFKEATRRYHAALRSPGSKKLAKRALRHAKGLDE